MRLLTLIVALLVAPLAAAGSLAGVTLPDTVTVGGRPLALKGMGLREKYFFDIYVGGLYVPSGTSDVIGADVPKRLVLHFVYREVTGEQMAEAFEEGLAHQPNAAALRGDYDRLAGMMETVHAGDEMVFDYVPGTGVVVTVKGQAKGTIPGTAFMRSFFTVFVGDHPPTSKLKRGLLGG